MKRRTFLGATTGAMIAAMSGARVSGLAQSPALRASVTIDPKRELGRIDPKLYGHQIEHLERVVYGGFFDPTSRFADKDGLRNDVIEAVREMGGARVMRWPGGNFASYYRWKDGIGPRGKRPRRYDVVWKNYESNYFGTDEFLALCRRLECEPFITANMGSGTVEEACQWVEYCRLEKRQPPVNIWGLGNEHYGPWQAGHYTAEEYARKAAQFGQFMQAVQPGLKFMGVGYNQPEWNDVVLKRCGSMLEWLSIHLYGHRYFHDGVDDFDQIVATPAFFEREIKAMADQMALIEPQLRRKEPLKICLEEWNDRHSRQGQLWREGPRNIVDALFVAGVFNVCQRLSERVTMTNYVFIVNAHSPIFVYPEGIVKTPLFDLYRLYATKMQPVAIQAEVKTESFSAELPKATVTHSADLDAARVSATRVDVSATRSVDGRKLAVALLNRDKSRTAVVALEMPGRATGATLHTLTASGLTETNSLHPQDQADRVRASAKSLPGKLDSIELPPHSVNVLELSLD